MSLTRMLPFSDRTWSLRCLRSAPWRLASRTISARIRSRITRSLNTRGSRHFIVYAHIFDRANRMAHEMDITLDYRI